MQRQISQPGYISIPFGQYDYVVSYLEGRFGHVKRVGNDFWRYGSASELSPTKVATVMSPAELMLAGRKLLSPEICSVEDIVEEEKRTKGAFVKIHKILHTCSSCSSFFVFPEVRKNHVNDSPSGQGAQPAEHDLTPLGEMVYTTRLRPRKPLYQTKGWINPDVVVQELAKYMGEEDAELLTQLRVESLKEGTPMSLEWLLLAYEESPAALFTGDVYQRALAHLDARESESIRLHRKRTHNVAPAAVQTSKNPTAHGVAKGAIGRSLYSSFLCWKISDSGQILSDEQKHDWAVEHGFVEPGYIDALRRARASTSFPVNDRDDERPIPKDTAPQRKAKTQKNRRAWRRRELRAPAERTATWRDYVKSTKGVKTVREVANYDVSPHPAPPEAPPTRPEEAAPEEPDNGKEEFCRRFGLSETDIAYANGQLLRATKVVYGSAGMWTINVLNQVMYPQRALEPGEFSRSEVSLADDLAKELRGGVAVTESRAKGLKSLVVLVDSKYTVRVASKPL